MSLEKIKRDAPPNASHYCLKQEVYIHVDNAYFYFLNGDWIQYDDSCRMELLEL